MPKSMDAHQPKDQEAISPAVTPADHQATLSDLPHPPLNPPTLSSARRRALRAQAHHLRPVVQVGQAGITLGVINAVRAALARHELIKISINSESPTDRERGATQLSATTGAHAIQVIGRVLILFRRSERPRAQPVPPQPRQSSRANARASSGRGAQRRRGTR